MSLAPELSLQKGAYTTEDLFYSVYRIPSEIRGLASLNVFKTSFHRKGYFNTPWLIVTLIIIEVFVFLTL